MPSLLATFEQLRPTAVLPSPLKMLTLIGTAASFGYTCALVSLSFSNTDEKDLSLAHKLIKFAPFDNRDYQDLAKLLLSLGITTAGVGLNIYWCVKHIVHLRKNGDYDTFGAKYV